MRYIELLENEDDDLILQGYTDTNSNKWVSPRTNFHKILILFCSYGPDGEVSEAEAARLTNTSQGFSGAAMFNTFIKYKIALKGSEVDRYIKNPSDKAFDVLELLNNGMDVNLKNMDIRETKLADNIEDEIVNRIRLRPDNHKVAILIATANGPITQTDFDASSNFSAYDTSKYANSLASENLITVTGTSKNKTFAITDLGKKVLHHISKTSNSYYEKKYANMAKKMFSEFKNDYEYWINKDAFSIIRRIQRVLFNHNVDKINKFPAAKVVHDKLIAFIKSKMDIINQTTNDKIAKFTPIFDHDFQSLMVNYYANDKSNIFAKLEKTNIGLHITPENMKKVDSILNR
jgi:predicted transcriptional regulator